MKFKLFRSHEEKLKDCEDKLERVQDKREKVEEIAEVEARIDAEKAKINEAKGIDPKKKSGWLAVGQGLAKELVTLGESLDKGLGKDKPIFKKESKEKEPKPFKLDFNKRV